MKHLVVLLVSLVAFGTACGKANDVPAMKAEAEGMMKNYQVRLGDLNRRAESIMQRGNAIGVTSPDAANASRMFAMAKTKLEQLRADVGMGAGELAKMKDRLELKKYVDRKSKELEEGTLEINADFDAVESWIGIAESRPQVSQRQPVVPPPPPANPDAPPPAPVQ